MTEHLTRAERRAQSRGRSRAWLAIGAGILVVVLAVIGVVVVAGGGDDGDSTSSGSRPVAHTNVTLAAGEITSDSAGAPVTVTPEQAAAVVDTIGAYLSAATVQPLRGAPTAGDLASVFDAAALARVSGADRVAMVDEGLPKVTGDIDAVAQPVAITGLGDQDGNLVLITATVDFDITGTVSTKGAPLHIVRSGTFVFTPDAAGVWKVSAYQMTVGREGGGIDPTTTTAGTTP